MVSTPKDMSRWIQPAHTISFVPPVTIVNLLPCHLSFRIVYFSNSTEKITSKSNTDISPGKKSFISVSEYRYLLNTVCQNKGPGRVHENQKIQRSFQGSFG